MNLAILPIILPQLTALAALFWGAPSPRRRAFVALAGLAQLAVALLILQHNWQKGTVVLGVGYWSYRVGIVLVIDLLAALMISLSTLVALVTILYGYLEKKVEDEHPLRLVLVQLLVMGINLSFCTGDLFNLFVAFEVMLIASYALLTLEADNWSVKQAFPYLAINLFGGTLFLCAAGLAYSMFGTLNFADIAARAGAFRNDPRLLALGGLMALVFCTKAGVFPLGYWLPNSYPTLPIPLAALFASMLTKVGVYVLLRAFGTVLPHDLAGLHQLLVVLACLTMVLTILGALARPFVRGILAFNLLSHIGFMILAIGLFTPRAFAAAIFYMIHHIVVMASLFLITGVALRLNHSDELRHMGNLWRQTPWFGVLFLLQALSLAGLPPLSGFWGKYLILDVALQKKAWWPVAALLGASILTLLSMLRIWNQAFWRSRPHVPVRLQDHAWSRLAGMAAVLVALSLLLGVAAEPGLRLAMEAADRVLNQSLYIEQVFQALGKAGP